MMGEFELEVQDRVKNQDNGNTTEYNGERKLGQLEIAT
jgi:hypothetical protein